MCEYFKICVALLTALATVTHCAGVEFYCESCGEGVEWKEWGKHVEQKHKGEYQKLSFLKCPYSSCCCLLMPPSSPAVDGKLVEWADKHMRSTHGDKFITYDFWCKKCETVVSRYFWEMHLVQKHEYIDEFAKHKEQVKDYLPQYAFYCGGCKETYETALDWGRHVYKCQGRLKKEGKMKCFYCPLCKEMPETFYEDHIGKYHPKRCIYCFQTFDKERERETHMKTVHKTFCPLCGKNEFEVPLTVHIARDHEIWEGGPCPWDRRYEVCCTACLSQDVIQYRNTNSYSTDEFMVGFYSKSEEEIQEAVYWHFVEEHKCLESQFSRGVFGVYEFVIEKELAKMQRVKPCQWLDFPYSGFHVLLGHNRHKKGSILLCRFCKSPVMSENSDTWHTEEEVLDAHWNLSHLGMDFCQLCKYVYQKEESLDEHLIREHKNEYWECPECKKAVKKGDLHHGWEKHSEGIAFCTKCKRIGTGSCPNCGEWVFEQCEKCPQRVYGTCPQCEEAAFGSCPECRQCITGKCSLCKEEVKGECPTCLTQVRGRCPVCGKGATGWCSKCKQRVVGTCPVCGKCALGACSDCRQRVGVDQKVYSALKSHMTKEHGEKLQLDKKAIDWLDAQAGTYKDDKNFRWCEACDAPVPNKEEALIAHCRDRHKYSKHGGWCALCKWDFDGTREEHLRRNHRNKMEHCYGCNRDVLQGLSKWHSMRHVCYCVKCECNVPFEHMVGKHRCTSECKPTVDYERHVWIFNHEENCDNRHWWKCDFKDCKKQGSGDDAFREHIIKDHKCTEKCTYWRENFQFKVAHDGCEHDKTTQVNCPFDGCRFSGMRAQVLSHVYNNDFHGCRKGKCVYRNGRVDHDIVCKNRILECPFVECKFSNTLQEIRNHMHERHNCIKDFCTFAGGVLKHCVICPNRVFDCPACHAPSVTKQHLKDVHNCDDFCHDNGNGGIDHHYNCDNRDKF